MGFFPENINFLSRESVRLSVCRQHRTHNLNSAEGVTVSHVLGAGLIVTARRVDTVQSDASCGCRLMQGRGGVSERGHVTSWISRLRFRYRRRVRQWSRGLSHRHQERVSQWPCCQGWSTEARWSAAGSQRCRTRRSNAWTSSYTTQECRRHCVITHHQLSWRHSAVDDSLLCIISFMCCSLCTK